MSNVANTKYSFSNSYSGAPTGLFSGMAGYYHGLGGWNAETDRRASKRAEGLQQFKDYVNTLTENGIVPTEETLANFLAKASDYGVNASYGFDPYSAQQLMESAIKEGERKKKEIAERQVQEEAKTNESFLKVYSQERAQSQNAQEALKNLQERFPDLDQSRFEKLSMAGEDKYNQDLKLSIDGFSSGILTQDEAKSFYESHPNMTQQAKTYMSQQIELNRRKHMDEIVSSVDPSIAQGKSDEEILSLAKSKIDPRLSNDHEFLTQLVQKFKTNSISEAAKATNTARSSLSKDILGVIRAEQQYSEAQQKQQEAAVRAQQEAHAADKRRRDDSRKAILTSLAKKGIKSADKMALNLRLLENDYWIDDSIKQKLLKAENVTELQQIFAENRHNIFSYDEIQGVDEADVKFTHPSKYSTGYGVNKNNDYFKFVNNAKRITDVLVGNLYQAVQKDREAGIDTAPKLEKFGQTLADRLQTVRDGLVQGGGHNYSAQELLALEQQYVMSYLNQYNFTNSEKQAILSAIGRSLGEAPDVKRRPTPFEEFTDTLQRETKGMAIPTIHESSYFQGGNRVPASSQQPQSPPSVEEQWRMFTENDRKAEEEKASQTPSPVSKNEASPSVLDIVIPPANAKERPRLKPDVAIKEGVYYDKNTGKPSYSPYVSSLQKRPVTFFNSIRYDDQRLNDAATHIGYQYGLPPGFLNAIKNGGERSHNWQKPNFKKTGSTAKGVMQITDTTRKKAKTIYGSLDHNPLNAVENMEAAAKLLSSECQRIAKRIPITSRANPWIATVIQYNVGTEACQRYIKTGDISHLKPHEKDYLKRVLQYMNEHGNEEEQRYKEYIKLSSTVDPWDVALN